ncbi:MAG TPA: FGGY family carbohydrate kinase, partial [Chloroflexota bacterium]|nr:FGGY family carbohydrate kinase [Chloroflexota bacterium]
MSEGLFVGLDVGTSGSRAVLYDTSGRQVATTHHGYPLETPHPGWAEQNPDRIWQRIVQTLADLSKLIPPGARVEALGISSIC